MQFGFHHDIANALCRLESGVPVRQASRLLGSRASIVGISVGPRRAQIIGMGGSYTLAAATAGLTFTSTKFDDANGTTSSVRFDNYDVWAKYEITPKTTMGGAFIYTSGKVNYNGETPKYYLLAFFSSYALSKTTALYAMSAVQQAGGSAPNADIFDYAIADASSTDRQLMVRIGLSHLF
jgi:predicted porin